LNLRILMVSATNEPVGELAFAHDLLVKEFTGGLASFSNRVRTISAQFFGQELLRRSNRSIRCFWVLVPASVDQEWVLIQKEAIRAMGLRNSQVSHVEAKIIQAANGYELAITKVVPL